jgi:hypothetical protein
MEKKIGKVARKIGKFGKKLNVLFSMGTAGPIWLILFFNVRNSPNEIFMKKKMEKLPGKLENSRETDGAFFLWDFCDGYA